MIPHLIINRVDRAEGVGARVRCFCAFRLIFVVDGHLWDSDATLSHLKLLWVEVFDFFAMCRWWNVSIVFVVRRLLICLKLLGLVTTANDMVLMIRHSLRLAIGWLIAALLCHDYKRFWVALIDKIERRWLCFLITKRTIIYHVTNSQPPFLFLHFPRDFLHVHGSKCIWNCF